MGEATEVDGHEAQTGVESLGPLFVVFRDYLVLPGGSLGKWSDG